MNPRTLRLIAMPILAALLLAACNSSPAPAATVAGTQVTDDQLAHEAQLFTFLAALNQQPCGGPAPEGETQEAVCNRFTLTNMIQEQVVRDYATANDVSVPDSDVTDIIGNLDQQLGAKKVDEELGKQQLSRDDLKELAGSVLLFQNVQKKVVESQLGEDKLRDLYDQDILQYTTVEAEHILVDTQAEAEHVYKQVTAPGATEKTFQALARKLSTDTDSAKNGGSLGTQVAATYVPEFGQAVVALDPGEISAPVQTQYGWHVIKLITKQVTPFEQAKPQLVQSQSTTVFNDWLRTQIGDQGLEVNPKYGTFDQETLTVVAVDSTDPSATDTPSPGAQTPVSATPTS